MVSWTEAMACGSVVQSAHVPIYEQLPGSLNGDCESE